jgi:glycine/D-amino acid oxidase-like deaminating enzyme
MKVVIVGAGINGVTAAIELQNRGHQVALVDPGPLPHPLAASTDISKAVRAGYGPDEDYAELADRSIERWRKWNIDFGTTLYHEVGCLFLRHKPAQPGDFEFESLRVLEKRGHPTEQLKSSQLRARFPAFSADYFSEAILDPVAGFAESGGVVTTLVKRASSIGVELRDQSSVQSLVESDSKLIGVTLVSGERIRCDKVVIATGAWTPSLLPFTQKFFRATGHPVAHFKPSHPELFGPGRFPFFGADISTTGFYGFPLNRGVVKIANHGPGREMPPDSPQRVVTPEEEESMREFLRAAIPALADAPIVYTRICLYCDTHDGDFWIAADPDRPHLVIAAGDSGHGFKFAPILGEIIADAVEEKQNRWLKKFRWRPEVQPGAAKEAARFAGEHQ